MLHSLRQLTGIYILLMTLVFTGQATYVNSTSGKEGIVVTLP